jgi:hypothetical protein
MTVLPLLPRDSVLADWRDALPQCIKQKIGTEQYFFLILRSVNGIHYLLDVPEGTACNATFFTDAVLPSLIGNVGS